ncbi:MAG: hypothetical protein JRJ66_09415 [Deltaproteobacteria bacterium]|nr:hypothetical protein [Deltaproteobacteria bacterium]MBW2022115.1 hypothetical protein [Deltaproteobacteria bacterium]MBW2045233.1 hypothetical protein [Deltaproteobacteria bacterium]MBW2300213.1 hypothetical protein [Deltaproteobacteria bacterium]
MRINKDRLNPLYDQYSNEENRLTHALLHTIGSSQWLFSRFLREIVGVSELATSAVARFSVGAKAPGQQPWNMSELENAPNQRCE